jgi:hypothetical protein
VCRVKGGGGGLAGPAIFMFFEKIKWIHMNICVRNNYKLLLYNF